MKNSIMRLRLLAVLSVFSVLSLPLDVQADRAAEQLALATYKLSNTSSTATGVVISVGKEDENSRHVVLTANHVFEQMTGDSFNLVSRKRQEDGTFQRLEIKVVIRRNGNRLWIKHAKHDIAILLLPNSVAVNALPSDCIASREMMAKVHAGDAVRLAVFPERSEANNAGFPYLRSGSIASYPVTPVDSHPVLLIDTTSWPGDSGGPVMHRSLRSPSGGPFLIGVVRGMRSITDKVRESRFVERKTDYPLGISEVLDVAFARELIRQVEVQSDTKNQNRVPRSS